MNTPVPTRGFVRALLVQLFRPDPTELALRIDEMRDKLDVATDKKERAELIEKIHTLRVAGANMVRANEIRAQTRIELLKHEVLNKFFTPS